MAIKLNPQASKAYYRSGRALIELERYEDALDACQRCLAFDANNLSVKNLIKDADTKIEKRNAALKEKERKANEAKAEKELLELSCAVRPFIPELSLSIRPLLTNLA